jgi:hypothetical protein
MSFTTSRRSFLYGAGALAACATPLAIAAASVSSGIFQADARLLAYAYRTLHPGLLRYAGAAEWEARFDALDATLSRPQTLAGAYLAFARITAAVRCGHSYPNFYNQSDAIRTALFSRRDKLPFLFRWIGERMIVTRDLSAAGLSPGTEIHTIEGTDVRLLLRSLMPLARADGHNDAKRRQILAVNAVDRFQAFDIYLPMQWPTLLARGRVRILATDPGGVSRRLEMPLMVPAEREAALPSVHQKPKDAILWSIEHKPGAIACLSMPSWSVYNSSWDWRAWLEAQLDTIASDGTRALIIDLRGNEGGLDCGNAILARLVDRDVALVGSARRVRAPRVPDDLRPHVDTWDTSIYDWGDRATGPRPDGLFDLIERAGDANGAMTIKPAGKRFRGKLIVLTDASNSSATFGFVQHLKINGLATIVGETTGGNRRGINGGAFLFLRLPTSGIEVDIPLIGYFPPNVQPDAGILPDLRVKDSPADIASEFDRTMAVALRAAQVAVG